MESWTPVVQDKSVVPWLVEVPTQADYTAAASVASNAAAAATAAEEA